MRRGIKTISLKGLALRALGRSSVLKRSTQAVLRWVVSRPKFREKLNSFYRALDDDEVVQFYSVFAKAFVERADSIEGGVWTIALGSEELKIPLRRGTAWLDWDTAVSVLGHDNEVKTTYRNLLNSTYRPKVFFDIGANYGTHSLIFLRHKVRAISFEPNPVCTEYFESLCSLNGVIPETEAYALSDSEGQAEFLFPQSETWLGTIAPKTRDSLAASREVAWLVVRTRTLDDYVTVSGVVPDLIKIDTEGNEVSVFAGAGDTMARHRPMVVFEAGHSVDRIDLWNTIADRRYKIFELPFSFAKTPAAICESDFLASRDANFFAIPGDHPGLR